MDPLHIEILDAGRQDRTRFCCGDPSVHRWLREHAPATGKTSGVRVEVATIDDQVVGCYCLASFQIEGRPRHREFGSARPAVPSILVSRLVSTSDGSSEAWARR